MNRTFSSKIPKKPSLALAAVKKEESNRRKKKRSPSRNPLQDLNAISSCSSSNCSEASSVSMEGPRCCLRFSLSHHHSSSSSSSNSKLKTPFRRPKTLSKTPKSAPFVRVSKLSKSKHSKENTLSKSLAEENSNGTITKRGQKLNNNPRPYQRQSGKKTGSRTAQKSKSSSVLNNGGDPVNKSEGEELARVVGHVGEVPELKPLGAHAICTPLTKIASGPGLDCKIGKVVEENSNRSNNSKTPPVLASVSPEIQCGSSVVSTTITPGCYGAGQLVSGVTDKRKCRSRGILTVGENDSGFGSVKPFDSLDDFEDVVGIGNDSTVIPEPAEASMHWVLSPCNEENEDLKENSENGSCRLQRLEGFAIVHSPSSPATVHEFSSDLCSDRNTASTTDSNRRRSTLISPNRLSEFDGLAVMSSPHATASWGAITLKEGRESRCDLGSENSPFSMNSLCSGNVMQTPQSDSSSGRLCLSWLNEDSYKKHQFESELNSAAEVLQMTTLSPKGQISIGDPLDSSLQFDNLTTSSNSINFTQFPKSLDDQASWISNSTLDNVSQSQMRISWREGLVSQIYEIDDSDCCRCLSDEEEDANNCSNDRLKPHHNPVDCVDVASDQILTNNSRTAEFVDNDSRTYGKDKGRFRPQISCSCAESISTDGGGLVASRDSDWNLDSMVEEPLVEE